MKFINSPNKYMDLINEIEKNFPVDKWQINGIDIWPSIRLTVTSALIEQLTIKNTPTKYQLPVKLSRLIENCMKSIKLIISHIQTNISDRKQNLSLNQKADIVILSDMAYRTRINNLFYAKESDYFYDTFRRQGYSVQVLENNGASLNRFPRYSSTSIIAGKLKCIRVICKTKNIDANNFSLPEYDKFLSFLQKDQDLSFLAKHVQKKYIAKKIVEMEAYANFFEERLRCSHASIAMVVCYYTLVGQAFCLGARRAGIQCFDIQHGIAGTLHRAYGRWKKTPPTGFNTLPTGFWSWGKDDMSAIKSWGDAITPQAKVILGGNVWAKLWSQKDLPLTQEERNKTALFLSTLKGKKIILVTLQYPFLPSILEATINKTNNNVFWLIRCHPRLIESYQKIQVGLMKFNNVNLLESSTLPLFLLLPSVTLHITMSSAVVEDARLFSVNSVIIDKSGKDFFQKYIDSGDCFYAETSNDLINIINNHESHSSDDNSNNCNCAIEKITSLYLPKKIPSSTGTQ